MTGEPADQLGEDRAAVAHVRGLPRAYAETAPEAVRPDWAEFLAQTAVGAVWTRPGLPLRVRALITVAALAALRCESELRLEVSGALALGVTGLELYEAMVQVSGYAGVVAARTGLAVLGELLDGEEEGPPSGRETRHPGDRMRRGRAVLGELRPDLSAGAPPSLKPLSYALPWNAWLMETAFGDLWNRPNLSLVDREWVTLSALIALGQDFELDAHFRTTHYLGIPPEQVREAIIHLAIYVGFPFGGRAIRIAAEVFDDLGTDG